jgi:hypothetical protein
MDRQNMSRKPEVTFALTAALLWSTGLLVASLVAPIYNSSGTNTDNGAIRSVALSSSTLVGVNGARVLIVVAMPAVATALVWLALRWKSSRASRYAVLAAWAIVWLLAALCLVGAFSIGLFMAPVAVLLGYATGRMPSGASPHPRA